VIIDAHHHVWDLAVRDQPWTADLPVLRRSFTLDDLRPELERAGIDGTVLVQTIAVPEETPEFLAMAQANDEVLGVVGWVDLTEPGIAEEIARLRALPGGAHLVGIRHQVQAEPDPEWLLREDVRRGLRAIADAGLVYELLVTRDQLPAAVAAVERDPDVTWVLDHAGRPPVAGGRSDEWGRHLSRLAMFDTVACKLSGLVTEADENWTPALLAPYADHLFEAFGADRVMFGSDWPVCLLRTGYPGVVDLTQRLVASLSDTEQADVWGGTAVRWYGLGVG
jgi:L-fuconolactonase